MFATLLIGFILCSIPLQANTIGQISVQDDKTCAKGIGDKKPHNFNPQTFKANLMAYITQNAGLNADESKRFFPLFFEMREKGRAIEHQKERALRSAAQQNMSEKDCQRVLAQNAELNAKAVRIEKQYMERLCKIVGSQKLIKAINADHDFGRNFFKRITRR